MGDNRSVSRVPGADPRDLVKHIDRAFDLPNRTINLLIQWIRQNNGRMPERRRSAPELLLLKPQQIERIEAIVAGCFPGDDAVGD